MAHAALGLVVNVACRGGGNAAANHKQSAQRPSTRHPIRVWTELTRPIRCGLIDVMRRHSTPILCRPH